MENKLKEDMTGMSTVGHKDTSSSTSGGSSKKPTLNMKKKDFDDKKVMKSLEKTDVNINLVDEESTQTMTSKLKYLSNVKGEDGQVSQPFEIEGKKYQMVRAEDEKKQRVNGVYCLDETDESGENIILSQENFENAYMNKTQEVQPAAPQLTMEKEAVEKEAPKSLNLGSYKHFFVNTKTGKVKKMKTAEELANATKSVDEKYMGLPEFRKYVNGSLFGSKKKNDLTEQPEGDLHAKATKLMAMIVSKIPTGVIDSVKSNPQAQKEVIETFAEMIGVPRNMLTKIITSVKDTAKVVADKNATPPASPSVTANDGGMTFESVSSKSILKTIKVKDLKK